MRADETYLLNFPPPSDDGRVLRNLQEWIKFYGGYHNIPPAAWALGFAKPIARLGALIWAAP